MAAIYPALILVAIFGLFVMPASAAATTEEVIITKLASDGVTVINQTTVDWRWMMENLPVVGDGETTYYTQGPIFEAAWDDVHPDEDYDPWNPTEDVNLFYKDHGEFMGSNVSDLLELVGGAAPSDIVKFTASDGLPKQWPAEYIMSPDPRQGTFCLAWYHGNDTGYVNESFNEGMRLYFMSDVTNADGLHVWGNWDMHESWAEDYWYYYSGIYPAASGVSVKYVKYITIYSDEAPPAPSAGFDAEPLTGDAPLTVFFNDTSTGNPGSWGWDFGDGTISDEQNPEHTYQNEGIYTVTLTASNEWGNDSFTAEGLITVTSPGNESAISLLSGWNFVSVPNVLADGYNTADILSDVGMSGRPVYRYDTETGMYVSLGADDLLGPLEAYWVYSNAAATIPLTFDNTSPAASPERSLCAGWNGIGITGLSSKTACEALNSVCEEWSCVFAYETDEQMYGDSIINGAVGEHSDERALEPTKGYWVFMKNAGVLCENNG